jgi:alkylhydroperoxidase family enzyme
MARIPLPTRESLPDDLKERWDRTAARGPVLNIMRAFFVNRDRGQTPSRCGVRAGCRPGARIVILRAAFVRGSTYEWHQHVRIARDAGLTDDVIDAVRNGEKPRSSARTNARCWLSWTN